MKRRLIALTATALMLGALGAQSAAATTPAPTPETFAGNNSCPEGSTKIDPVESGTYNLVGGGTITITVRETDAGPVFDFDASGATVGSVVVKGGPNYNVYIFAGGADSSEGLHSPQNAKNLKWYGLSHLCFESEKKEGEVKK